jgi:hypothetical protein
MTSSFRYTNETNVYNRTGLSQNDINLTTNTNVIVDAENELDMEVGRRFDTTNTRTEYFSFRSQDVVGNSQSTITLSNYPIQSITLFNQLDMDGNSINTFELLTSVQISAGIISTDDYWLDVYEDPVTSNIEPTGKIQMKTVTFPESTNGVVCTYTYGYSSVPSLITQLATCMAGIKAWKALMGINYNKADSYSIPQQNVNKGNLVERFTTNIKLLEEEKDTLLNRIGRKSRTLYYSSGNMR